MTLTRPASLLAMLALLGFLTTPGLADQAGESHVPIRIGWQIPAATQGQVVQILKRTNVMEKHGLRPVFVPFSYGQPQVQAAFSGKLDVFFSGDQPAINLIARGGKWKIVGRLFEDGVGTIVPPNSPIHDIPSLEGKVVASPFGSVAHRNAFREQEAAGLDPGRDVINEDLDILEIRRRVEAGGNGGWQGIDAAVVWEPSISRFATEGLARSISSGRYLGVIAVSSEFIEREPDAVVKFLMALASSWYYLAQRPDQAMDWYIEDTRLDYTPQTLVAARLDANFSATDPAGISLALEDRHFETLRRAAAWARDAGEGDVDLAAAVDTGLLAAARQALDQQSPEDLQVILPLSRDAAGPVEDLIYDLGSAPLSIVFAAMVAIAILSIEIGFVLGRVNRKHVKDEQLAPIATVAGAVLAMMAFVIALTFGSANTRFDARKAALLEDVTAIQTAYLRANLIAEPHRTTIRSLLRDYVQVRAGIVYAYGQPERLSVVEQRARVLQDLMWSHVEALAEEPGEAELSAFFARSLNDVFNLHTKRVVLGTYYRIPPAMWLALILASSVAMFAVGFQFGIGGNRRIHIANLALAMTFALVMVLAFDLDRAGEGLVAVNQQPMLDLYQAMRAQ